MDNSIIENLNKLFDLAWSINIAGNGTDLSRMVTSFIPDAIQELSYYEEQRDYD